MTLKNQMLQLFERAHEQDLVLGQQIDELIAAYPSRTVAIQNKLVSELNRLELPVLHERLSETRFEETETDEIDPELQRVDPGVDVLAVDDLVQLTREDEQLLFKRFEVARNLLLTAHDEAFPRDKAKGIEVVDDILTKSRPGRRGKVGQVKFALFRLRVREFSALREDIVQCYLFLVARIGRRYSHFGMPLDDLVQEGNIGLLRAVNKFDWRRNCRFGTYATWWIQDGIKRSLSNNLRTVRVPIYLQQRLRRLMRSGEIGPNDEVKDDNTAGLSPTEVRRVLRLSSGTVSLERSVDPDERGSLRERLEDEKTPAPAEIIEETSLRRSIRQVLSSLPEREREVLKLRFGIGCDRTHTLEEIGTRFDVSRERIRQLQMSALSKLKLSDQSHELAAYL
ncbi:MAG: RNA polymerase sigma factor RpoD/SigA [Planctomycetota bacterium]